MFSCNSLTSRCKKLSNLMVHISCSYFKCIKHGDYPGVPLQVPHPSARYATEAGTLREFFWHSAATVRLRLKAGHAIQQCTAACQLWGQINSGSSRTVGLCVHHTHPGVPHWTRGSDTARVDRKQPVTAKRKRSGLSK